MMAIFLSIPLVPVSCNHYKKPRGNGRRGSYVTAEAMAFKHAVAALCRDRIRAGAYDIKIDVFLGERQRGDLDNFAKVVLDSLVFASVIDTDARVTRLAMSKQRDRDDPRTEITVAAVTEAKADESR